VYALLRKLVPRARDERGFGMVELVIAMAVMSVGILAVFGMFQSGVIAIERASIVSTAAAIADSEVENFRAVKYNTIGIASTDIAAADATYKADSAYKAVSSPVNQVNSAVVVAKCPASPCTNTLPTRTATGADGRSYRVDTFITWQAVQNSSGVAGRDVKLVTIVVRDANGNRVRARVATSFDEATGT
jgi:prepilin-type N-terminal cleavage/methylation domain-containing protein